MQSSRYLRPEDVRKLKNYELGARLMVEGWLSGRHRSRQRGASIEFHEYRAYTPGDDLKLVDWRVFARSDKHFLKTFEQETDMECHLLVDSSASMGFPEGGAMSKLDYASFFAACMAWLVVRQTDKVGLHLFDDRIRFSLPPGSTQGHLHEILQALEKNVPGRETDLASALDRTLPVIRRKATLVILSDFYDDPVAVFNSLNPYIHRGFRIHLVQVVAPEEMDLAPQGLARFVDMETGERLTVHTGSLREAYREAVRERTARMRALAVSRQVDFSVARTDESYFMLFDKLAAKR